MKKIFLGFLSCLVVFVLLEFTITLSGIFPISAKATPPRWEKKIANFALDRCFLRQAPERKNPLPVTEANLFKGLETYQMNCAICHGDALNKSKWGSTSFYPRVPQFGKKPDHMSESLIFWIEKNGIRYTGMASFESILSDDEMWQVAMFLHRLDSLPPKVNAKWHSSGDTSRD